MDEVTEQPKSQPLMDYAVKQRNYGDYMRMMCSELFRLKKLAEETLAARDQMMMTNNHHIHDDHAFTFERNRTQLHYSLDRIYRLMEQAEMQLRLRPYE